jgi:hypothetical protein
VSAGDVAGLLVLLGVVGVLAAIVGSGIQAGPVKFPSIPGSRQRLLAVTSALVIAGGATWWAVQQQAGRGRTSEKPSVGTSQVSGKLRVSLIPARSNIRAGDKLSVRAQVYDSHGDQLGGGQCQLTWRDALANWHETTMCIGTFTEPSVTKPGVHHVVASAQGLAGLLARGGVGRRDRSPLSRSLPAR